MKRYLSLGFVMLAALGLTSCAYYAKSPSLNQDLTEETWQKNIDLDPNKWTAGADQWFLTGDPSNTEMGLRNASYREAVSTMMVKVPEFTNITINGSFHVEIFGTYAQNSVYVYGPNEDVRHVIVKVSGRTLYLDQAKNAPKTIGNVIVRVGVGSLNQLKHMGSSTVEAIQIPTGDLSIMSSGAGNVYLAGNVNLKQINQSGKGSVSVFGANSQSVAINASGAGDVNVSGRVGIADIKRHGKGNTNIIGADSDGLKISADGKGKIGIAGLVNIKEIQARDYTKVYIMDSKSNKGYIYALDRAQVGMRGEFDDVYIYSSQSSMVYARYLNAQNAFVRANDYSHINIAATNKIFAAATRNGSVYFFGEPRIMSQFVDGNGTVIPVWTKPTFIPRKAYRHYKDEAPQATSPRPIKSASSQGWNQTKAPYIYKWRDGKLVAVENKSM